MTPRSIFAALLVFLPVPALAQTIEASGVWFFTPQSAPLRATDTLVVIHVNNLYNSFEPTNPDNPIADSAGHCFGAVLIQAGQTSGRGICRMVHEDRDAWVIEWIAEDIDAVDIDWSDEEAVEAFHMDWWSSNFKIVGTWTVIDGNGKFAGASGSGTFRAGVDRWGTNKDEMTGEITLN